VAGLFSMIDVVLNYRSEGVPEDDAIRWVEGWIFGQNAQALRTVERELRESTVT